MNLLNNVTSNNWTYTALLLIDNGANVNSSDRTDNLPLHHSVTNNNLILVRKLLRSGSKKNSFNRNNESPVHIAVRLGHVKILKELVRQGSDVNVCEPHSDITPLHVAVSTYDSLAKFKELFDILVKGGCYLDCRAFCTLETPLHRAIDMRKPDISELLLLYGANPNIARPFDITTLQIACKRGNTHLVRLLINCGIVRKREKWLYNEESGTETMFMVQQWLLNAMSLQKLCRIAIRSYMIDKIPNKADVLPLPEKLKQFLLMDDLRIYCDM